VCRCQQLCVIFRLADHNLRFGKFLGKHPRNHFNVPTVPIAVTQSSNRSTEERNVGIASAVCTGNENRDIGFILEMPGHDSVRLGKLDGLVLCRQPDQRRGVTITSLQGTELSFRRSRKWFSAMVTTEAGDPLAAQTMARPIPVFPLVASMTVWPRLKLSRFFRRSDYPRASRILD